MPSAWNAVTFSILKQHRGLSLDFGSLSSTRVNKQNKTKAHRLAPQEKKKCRNTYIAKKMFQILNSFRIHCFSHSCILVLSFMVIFFVFHLQEDRKTDLVHLFQFSGVRGKASADKVGDSHHWHLCHFALQSRKLVYQ